MSIRTISVFASGLLISLTFLVSGGGCASAKIAMKEKVFGIQKREQLVARVEDARDEQQEAKQQFASALDEFLSITNQSGGDLEAKYRKFQKENERCKSQADDVRARIKDVDRVATALFKEWSAELAQYSSPELRRNSERQLADSQRQYDRLYQSMKQAEAKMDPVLSAFNDQVLSLKHMLNAQAIAGLQGTANQIQSNVSDLIREMEASIAESNAFIKQMQTAG